MINLQIGSLSFSITKLAVENLQKKFVFVLVLYYLY